MKFFDIEPDEVYNLPCFTDITHAWFEKPPVLVTVMEPRKDHS